MLIFFSRQVATGDASKIMSSAEWKPINDQEWTSVRDTTMKDSESSEVLEHRVKVGFKTEIYGTFRQSVVFDFGIEPVLVKHLCVDVVPVTDVDKMKEIRKVSFDVDCLKLFQESSYLTVPFKSFRS